MFSLLLAVFPIPYAILRPYGIKIFYPANIFFHFSSYYAIEVFPVAALILGIIALKKIGKRPKELSGKCFAWTGIIFGAFQAFVSFLVIGALFLASFTGLLPGKKAYDASAMSAGRNCKLAVEVYYYSQDESRTYTSDLGELLKIDKNLTDDRGVTLVFLFASESGYTFYTQHAKSKTKRTFTFTD